MYPKVAHLLTIILAPSLVLCHGQQRGLSYVYKYSTVMLLNNNDHKGKEPVGFGYNGRFSVENVWEDEANQLLKVSIRGPGGGQFVTRKGEERRGPGASVHRKNEGSEEDSYPLYAHILDNKEGQRVVAFYVHNSETPTRANLKKAVVFLTRTKKSSEDKNVDWKTTGHELVKRYSWTNVGQSASESVLVPEITDSWASESLLGRDHALVKEVQGWQNVTFRSRMYQEAHSKLHLNFNLKLVKEEPSEKSPLSSAKTVDEAITRVGEDFIEEQPRLKKEKKVCHECRSLTGLTKDYAEFLSDTSIASVPAAIGYLKVMERVRSGGPGTSKQDIVNVLQENAANGKTDILGSLFDILAGARTEQAISAALQFLDLPVNEDLNLCERFLSSLAASCMTSAQTSTSTSTKSVGSSHQFILEELLHLIRKPFNWSSNKLKWTTILTLGTLLKANNLLVANDDLNKEVVKLINSELRACEDADCRVAHLHALGNTANLMITLNSLEKYALDVKGKRESIAAMKAIKECLDESSLPLDDKLNLRLRTLALKVVYEPTHETTSRIIASEIITRYLVDAHLSRQLLRDVHNFENNEMATLMWSRALKEVPAEDTASTANNWLVHSTLFNGTSASFTRNMGGTESVNATYGIAMELMSKGKLLKESSFDVHLQGESGKGQHLLSVGIFARGLQGFAGGSDGGSEADDESTMAGMALRVLGIQLRPYVFFTGTGELMSHVWSGTASEPTTAFRGNLLISDHEDSHPLINGFLVEQQMRGVLSMDLSGQIQISLWNRNSHAVVKTKATLLMQGSQNILTSDVTTSAGQQFAFGGSTSVESVTDTDFYSTPFKMCIQMIQPQFSVRHNTRKFEQVDSDQVHRRIHRRNYKIPAKSYFLHRENNRMCSVMQPQ